MRTWTIPSQIHDVQASCLKECLEQNNSVVTMVLLNKHSFSNSIVFCNSYTAWLSSVSHKRNYDNGMIALLTQIHCKKDFLSPYVPERNSMISNHIPTENYLCTEYPMIYKISSPNHTAQNDMHSEHILLQQATP